MRKVTLPTKHPANFRDLSGQRFHRLTVLHYVFTVNKKAYFSVRCDCGRVLNMAASNLKYGNTSSCGCWYKEWSALPRPTVRRRKSKKLVAIHGTGDII